MLSREQLESNRNEYIALINSITRDFDKEALIHNLDMTDFFYAPATISYNCSYDGGLCQHTLNVYKALKDLSNLYFKDKYSEDTLKIVALCHLFGKINMYAKTSSNVKVYEPNGNQFDSIGRFTWKAVETYKVRDLKDTQSYVAGQGRFNMGNIPLSSFMYANQFIPLTQEESLTLIHYGSSIEGNIPSIVKNIPLILLLKNVIDLTQYVLED